MNLIETLFLLRERMAEAERLAGQYEREGRDLLSAGAPAGEVDLRRSIAAMIRRRIAGWRQDETRLRRVHRESEDETRIIDPREYGGA